MNLRSKRLILKEITSEDLIDFHHYFSNPTVHQFNTITIPQTLEDTKAILKSRIKDQTNNRQRFYSWVIQTPKTRTFMGEAGLTLSASKFNAGEIYYGLFPQYWGNGYATEIVQCLLLFCFIRLKLHRIEAGVAPKNIASCRVLEKTGFLKEGLRRKILPIRGEWIDSYLYAILEEDFKN